MPSPVVPQKPPSRSHRKRNLLLTFLAVPFFMIGWYYFDDLVAMIKDRLTLLHYATAREITEDEYKAVQSESDDLAALKEFSEAEKSILGRYIFGKKSDFSGWTVVPDRPSGVYYLFDSWTLHTGYDFKLYKFTESLKPLPYQTPPVPDWRKKAKEGFFACGLKGCSPFEELFISGDNSYVNLSPGGFADEVKPGESGVYFYDAVKETWLRITPSVDLNTLKLGNSGCTLYYGIQKKLYKLDVCDGASVQDDKVQILEERLSRLKTVRVEGLGLLDYLFPQGNYDSTKCGSLKISEADFVYEDPSVDAYLIFNKPQQTLIQIPRSLRGKLSCEKI